MQGVTHVEPLPGPASRAGRTALAIPEFFAHGRLRGVLGRVARVVSAPHAPTRREIGAEIGIGITRVESALDELRMLFLAPGQGQLPVRILHELITVLRTGNAAAPRLPCDRATGPSCWLDSLLLLREVFAALQLTTEEAGYAELLVDPDMLNQKEIAEILGLSGNRARLLRALLRSRVGASRRNQLRARLLHAAVSRLPRAVHPPSVSPVAPRRHLAVLGVGSDHQEHDAGRATMGRNDAHPSPRYSHQEGDRL